MKSPVFVIEGNDVHVFETMDDAAGYMEAIDVLNGEYEGAFDAEGRQLTIVAESDRSPVRIVEPSVSTDGTGRLRDALRQDLRHLQVIRPSVVAATPEDLEAWGLEQLVQARRAVELRMTERSRKAWWRRLGSRLRTPTG